MLKPRYFNFQVQPYVILFVERAGSTYLASALGAHPQILSLREEFAVLKQNSKSATEQLAWADDFLTAPFLGQERARGFKTKLVDILDPVRFADLLRRKQCKVLSLQRRNSVKGVVSTLNAHNLWKKTGAWNLLDESNRMPAFTVDPQQFGELLHQREQWDHELETYVDELSLPTLRLWYEDLLQDEDAFLKQIFAFLGVKPMPVQGRTYKHTPDDLSQAILNLDELRARWSGTLYEPMFDDARS
jgi:LPS sulfotransferase NodH